MRTLTVNLVMAILSVSLAQAQTRFSIGPRLGANLSTATFNNLEQSTSSSGTLTSSRTPLLGVQVGMVASIGKGPWMVQPALIFSQKGVRQKATATNSFFSGETFTATLDATSRVNFLELPVNVVYAFGADGQGFQVFAGPYLAMGVGGKAKISEKLTSSDPNSLFNGEVSGSKSFAFGSKFVEPDYSSAGGDYFDARVRRFDVGANLGIGYRTGPFQVQLSYAFGLLNAQPDYPASFQMENTTGYHRNAQLTATYFLPQFSW